MKKICPKCLQKNKFSKDKKRKDGLCFYCKKCNAKSLKEWRIKNPKRACESSKEWQKNHPEWEKNQWRKNNPDKAKFLARMYNKKARSSPKGQLNINFSNSIRSSLYKNKNGAKWENVVGYNLSQLKGHLENLFKPGMSWNNYGRGGWHVDHKIPISAFNFESYEDIDFKRCWALSNLEPLWEKDNLKKHAKLERPFQPFLKLKEVLFV